MNTFWRGNLALKKSWLFKAAGRFLGGVVALNVSAGVRTSQSEQDVERKRRVGKGTTSYGVEWGHFFSV